MAGESNMAWERKPSGAKDTQSVLTEQERENGNGREWVGSGYKQSLKIEIQQGAEEEYVYLLSEGMQSNFWISLSQLSALSVLPKKTFSSYDLLVADLGCLLFTANSSCSVSISKNLSFFFFQRNCSIQFLLGHSILSRHVQKPSIAFSLVCC